MELAKSTRKWDTLIRVSGNQTNMSHPIVSVLMTAYNREKYIYAAIESVLGSSHQDFELIVVDDASTDATVEIAQSFADKDKRVKVFLNAQNLGDYPNRNKAASYAKGKYIKYLDSDDMLYPYGLEVMVKSMSLFPNAGFGLSAYRDPTGPYPMEIEPRRSYLEHFNGYAHFNRAPGSSIIDREAFVKSGCFSGARMIGDTEFWFRIGRRHKMVKFMVDLYWSRSHAGQESATEFAKTENQKLEKKVIQNALAHPECPLSRDEAAEILSTLGRQARIMGLKKIIRKIYARRAF